MKLDALRRPGRQVEEQDVEKRQRHHGAVLHPEGREHRPGLRDLLRLR